MSTNDFTDKYKQKIDSMQTLYRFKGVVNTIADLSSIEEVTRGDVYKCNEDDNDYIWNGQEWVNIGHNVDFSGVIDRIEQLQRIFDMEDKLIVSPTEPTGDNRKKVWIRKGNNIYSGGDFSSGNINDSGAETSSGNALRTNNYYRVKGSTTYIASYDGTANTNLNVVACYDKDMNFILRLTGVKKVPFTVPENCKYIRLVFYNSNGITVNNVSNIMINLGSEALPYEEYIQEEIFSLINNQYEPLIIDGKINGNLEIDGDLTANNIIPTNMDLVNTKINFRSADSASGSTRNLLMRDVNNIIQYIDGINCYTKQGTTTDEGRADIMLGNNTAKGTEGNKTGRLRIYSDTSYYVDLRAKANTTASRAIYFPDNAGTIALTSDISDVRLKTNIKEIDDNVLKAINEVEIKQFKVVDEDVISFGVIAQELIEAFKKYNLNAFDYKLIIEEVISEEDNTLYYKVNYQQIMILKHLAKEKELNEKIIELETKLKSMQTTKD